MKNPNLIFALTVILLMFFGMVSGQDVTSKPDKATRLTTVMQERLKLDETQTSKVSKLNKETVASLQKLKTAEYDSKEQKFAALKTIRKSHANQLKTVLKPEQWSEYMVMRQEMRAKRQKRKRLGRGRSFNTGTDSKSDTEFTEEDLEDLGGIFDDESID